MRKRRPDDHGRCLQSGRDHAVNDARIFKNSTLYDKFSEIILPHSPNGIILGDAGYPLLEWLLVRYVENPGMTAAHATSL